MKHSAYFQPDIFGLIEMVSSRIRKNMFDSLIEIMRPTKDKLILDVGAGAERRRADGNFFEKLYPYPANITAVGMEDASFLEKEFPGLKFVKADGRSLAFADKSFDLAVSFATIEHVGSREDQRKFVRELCRVGRACCLITPNRWFPLEFHTILPFAHWFPPRWFRFIARCLGKEFFAKEGNLNLLSELEVLRMFPDDIRVYIKRFKLFGLTSNIMFYTKPLSIFT